MASTRAIHLIACTFLDPGSEALVFTPSFFMYDVSIALMSPGGIRPVQAGPTLAFDLPRFLAAITPRTRLIIVASPNNPTGATVPRADLLAIAAAAPHAVLMVDEAYFHFHGETTLPDIASLPNLLVTRTFSKAYGLANLRVGMVAGPARLIAFLRKASSPYNVNGVALAVLPDASRRHRLSRLVRRTGPCWPDAIASWRLLTPSASPTSPPKPTLSS